MVVKIFADVHFLLASGKTTRLEAGSVRVEELAETP
jgi:hypothetical protein